MVVVSNSTPLIYLAALSDFDLLRALFGSIRIPDAVHQEVVAQATGFPVQSAVQRAQGDWIQLIAVRKAPLVEGIMEDQKLQRGEAEAIVLAQELRANLLLLDQRRAVAYARASRIRVVRRPLVYVTAKRHGLIASVREKLDHLRKEGFWLKDKDYQTILAQLGEV